MSSLRRFVNHRFEMTRTLPGALKIIGLCLFVTATRTAVGVDLEELPSDLASARSADYCSMKIDQSELDRTLEGLASIIDNGDRSSTEEGIATALLISAGLQVAQSSRRDCTEVFSSGAGRFEAMLESLTRLLKGQGRYRRSRDRDIARVQKSIAESWLEDQVARQVYIALRTESRSGEVYWASRLATAHVTMVDARATRLMRELLDQWDWIDRHRFGAKVSEYAWLLVQHADDHPEFQKLALSRMAPYLSSGGIKKANYAYLFDRVAVNAGRKQRYGTQPIWECTADGRLELQPAEDPERLDERRASLGMKPAHFDLAQMAAGFCRN